MDADWISRRMRSTAAVLGLSVGLLVGGCGGGGGGGSGGGGGDGGASAEASAAWVAGMDCTRADGGGWCRPSRTWEVGSPTLFSADAVFRRRADTLIGSDDGGKTWTQRMPAAGAAIQSLYQPDASNAWMIWSVQGTDGQTISRTRDGGRSWTTLRTLTVREGEAYGITGAGTRQVLLYAGVDNFNKICLLRDVESGVYNYGCRVRPLELSQDGGSTWQEIGQIGSIPLWKMSVTPSGSLVWQDCERVEPRVDRCAPSSLISYSLDAGVRPPPVKALNWLTQGRSGDTLIVIPLPTPTDDGKNVIDPLLWRSDDGGRSWTSIVLNQGGTSLLENYQLPGIVVGQRRCGQPLPCEQLEVLDWGRALRYTSIDGGRTWSQEPYVPSQQRIDAFGDVLLDTAATGRLSSDAGRTWYALPTSRPINGGLSALPDGSLWLESAVTDDEARKIQVHRSIDGGRTWELAWTQDMVHPGDTLLSLWRFADGRVLALGQEQYGAGPGLYRSLDRGASWVIIPDLELARGPMRFFDANSGYVGGLSEYARTLDGGRTWVKQALPAAPFTPGSPVQRLAADGSAWQVGINTGGVERIDSIWRLEPGPGSSWQKQFEVRGSIVATYFVDAMVGYQIASMSYEEGAQLYRTRDGARSWQRVPLPSSALGLNAIYFVDADVGWLVGDAGRILHTSDGGVTWSEQRSGTLAKLQTVGAIDRQRVWVASEDGTLLFSATGGQ